MKWITFFSMLWALPTLSFAQMVVHDATNYQAAMEQLRKAEQTIDQLEEQIDWMRLQGEMQAEMFFYQDSVASEKLNTERLQDLRMARQKDLYEQIRDLSVPPAAYNTNDGAWSSELSQLLSGQGSESANALYDFLFPERSRALDAEEDRQIQMDVIEKRRALEQLMKKQSLHIALAYFKLATSEAVKAEELRRSLMHNEALSMSEGERVVALQSVNAILLRTIDLRSEAAKLIRDTLQPTAWEQVEQELESSRLRLRSTRLRFEELIPGYGNP